MLRRKQNFIGPRTYHDRNDLELLPEDSNLQIRLNDLKSYTLGHDMLLNSKKSKIMPFNFTKKYDLIPKFTYDSKVLETTYEYKLLGIICTSDRKWTKNIQNLVKKANNRMFFIRRLMNLWASVSTLKEAYVLFVRPALEMCAPLWSGALTQKQTKF